MPLISQPAHYNHPTNTSYSIGNSSINFPDASRIYNKATHQLEADFPELTPLASMIRLRANDRLLNTLLSHARTVLQLSICEGFEVKVFEAPHKVQDGKNGFLVEPGDWEAVGRKLLRLWTDAELYERMSGFAGRSVSDEVGAVGDALGWLYLADK